MRGRRRGFLVVLAAVFSSGGTPPHAAAGPCPPNVDAGCKGFLKSKHLALETVLGSGVDAAPLESVGVTADGRIGYGLRGDGALDEWDLGTGALRRVAIARFIALDPAGRWAIAPVARKGVEPSFWAAHGSGFELWDLASRRRVATTKVEWDHPLYFEFSRRRIFVEGYLGDSGVALLWDTATGKVRRASCSDAVLTPDGTRAICVGGGGGGDDDVDEITGVLDDEGGDGVTLWDLDRMKRSRRLPARVAKDRGSVRGVVVSPDGGRALVAFSHGRDGPHTSVIWNLASGKVDKGPAFDQSSGSRLRWSPGAGKSIWIGTDRDQGAGLYPGVGNDKRRTTWLGDADDRPRDAVFLPDGKRILTGTSGRGVMRLLNAADGRELRASRDVSGHLGEVLSLSITRDGSRLLSCGKDHTARLWDLQGNRPLRSIPLQAYDNPVALMTPDGTFAIASVEGLSVITLPEGKPRQVLVKDRNATPLAVSPDGSGVLARTPFGTTLWEIPSGREVWSQKQLGGAAAFSADQRRIYNGVEYKSIVSVIDAGSGVVKASFGQGGPASTFALAPREDFLILGGSDGVGRYDIPAGRFAWTIASRHYVRQVAISPDGRWFVVTGSLHWGGDKEDTMKRFPSRVELRSTADGAVVDALDLDSAALTAFSAAFTPDGRALLVGTEDGPILRFAVTP